MTGSEETSVMLALLEEGAEGWRAAASRGATGSGLTAM